MDESNFLHYTIQTEQNSYFLSYEFPFCNEILVQIAENFATYGKKAFMQRNTYVFVKQ